VISSIKNNEDLSLITTISFWDSFPLLLGGKINRKLIENAVKTSEIPTRDINEFEELALPNRCCQIL
jgi:hypothetical protein